MKILYGEATFGRPEILAVNRVLAHGWLSGGDQTALFEEEFAQWYGMDYALAVNSGSSANFIALQALSLPEGSEVITCALAFPTTVSPIYYHRLMPVYVDIESSCTYVIDLGEVEEAITPATKAIMFAHTLGNVCDMDYLMKIVKKYNLKLIEDCCDAVGSKWRGQLAGTFGNLATVSFYPSHHMTTGGEGGMIITNDKGLYLKCKSIRDWGRACYCRYDEKNINGACGHRFANKPFDHRYYYTNLGLNLKMTEMQATFGREQLKRLDGFIARRKENYQYLRQLLEKDNHYLAVPKPASTFTSRGLPSDPWGGQEPERDFADPSWFAFPLTFYNLDRSKIINFLEANGIQTRTLFAGDLAQHPAYKHLPFRKYGECLNADMVLRESFFVGIGPRITKKELRYMAKMIGEAVK